MGKVGRRIFEEELRRLRRLRREIRWIDIYTDFKKTYPKLSKDVIRYEPQGYLVIAVHFRDATKILYDYTNRRARFVS